MIVPTVHLNGTSKDELLRQVLEADRAVNVALSRLRDATPNARDYYPQGPDAFREASNAHYLRIARLQSVREELAGIYEAVEEQGK